MCTPEARVKAIAARLSAAGFTPRVTDHDAYTHIETEVPDQAPVEAWWELLSALVAADWWGSVSGSRSGRTAWACVNRNPRDSEHCPGARPPATRS